MGMLERFNDIVKSNITAIMDKFEDPEKWWSSTSST